MLSRDAQNSAVARETMTHPIQLKRVKKTHTH